MAVSYRDFKLIQLVDLTKNYITVTPVMKRRDFYTMHKHPRYPNASIKSLCVRCGERGRDYTYLPFTILISGILHRIFYQDNAGINLRTSDFMQRNLTIKLFVSNLEFYV